MIGIWWFEEISSGGTTVIFFVSVINLNIVRSSSEVGTLPQSTNLTALYRIRALGGSMLQFMPCDVRVSVWQTIISFHLRIQSWVANAGVAMK